MLMLLMFPYVYASDWTERKFYDSVMHLWAQLTCAPFFRPEIVLAHEDWRGRGPPSPTNNPISLDNKLASQLNSLPTQYRDSGVVYVANHQSWSDIYSLCWLGIPLKFISKKAIFFIPVAGWLMYLIGCVPLARKDKNSGKKALVTCKDQIRKGVSIFFFPEGTRTKTGQLQSFKIGAFKVAADAQCPIIPITIIGTGSLMPPGEETTLYEGNARVIVHDAILPHDESGEARSADQLCALAFDTIAQPLRMV